MNREVLLKIIMELESYDQRKAHKLGALLDEYDKMPEVSFKTDARKKIWNYAYNLFTSLLSRKSRNELYAVSTEISEMCYQVERVAKDGWYIDNGSAGRYEVVDGRIVEKAVIPRTYKKGYNIDEEEDTTVEERNKEIAFLEHFSSHLDIISKNMDRKQEIITYDYQPKNKKVPKELMELLITYLGFNRLKEDQIDKTPEKPKEYQHSPIH